MAQFLQNIYFARIIYQDGSTGFTNQMLSLCTSIIKALFLKKSAVAVDYFLLDFSKNDKACISDIIDMKKTNEYLKQKYNIILLDKNKMQFKLHKAYYGVLTNMIDLTDHVNNRYVCKNEKALFIPKNTNFNEIKGDPLIGHIKHFCMYYALDEYNFVDNFSESLQHDIISHPPSNHCNFDFGAAMFIEKCIPELLNDILKNITFIDRLIPKYSLIDNNIFDLYNKKNVLHLRLEDDALIHWGKQNNMSTDQFKEIIEKKYIGLIEKYINKNELSIILSYSPKNSVIDFLKTNNYPFYYYKKDENKNEREICAINDLFLSTKCNNTFIGNFWIKNLSGSTFSYYILKKLECPNVKKVVINLDNIEDMEDVFY